MDARNGQEKLPGITHIIAVASGKGGVGKSTVSVNLALALQQMGARTGIADTDVLGPSIPTMLGATGAEAKQEGGKIIPAERYQVKLISMAMLTGDDAPAILRGPMVSKYIRLFISEVAWGTLDYLILDLPPGTGDTQLTIAQSTPLSGVIIVTTPQDVSLNIARRGLRMFEKVKVPILGIVENMSSFSCPTCGTRTDIFRHGGGLRMSQALGVPFLGSIPIDPDITTGGDAGSPVVVAKPDSDAALAYKAIAIQLARGLAVARDAILEPFAWTWATDAGVPVWLESGVRPGGERTVPVGLRQRDPRTLSILWQDGARHDYDVRDLRLACRCALCVEETTGHKVLDPKTVRADVAPRAISSVGTYAITFAWNDGHSTGIYSFDTLRALGERAATQEAHDV